MAVNLTKKQREAVERRVRSYAACARKLGIPRYKKWTPAEKKAVQACVRRTKRTK